MKLTTHIFFSNFFEVILLLLLLLLLLLFIAIEYKNPSLLVQKILHVSALLPDHHQEQKYTFKNKTVVPCMAVEYI